jgi:radical SAM enzyme (TIGR01210 family)
MNLVEISNRQILATRGAKNRLDPWRPYAYFVEPERGESGQIESAATIFLTNRECPFRCLMCDLWKNTLDARVPVGAISRQIDHALAELGPAQLIKLYNSGNFFDPQAIPPEEFPAIAGKLTSFQRVIVESHPKLCGADCFRFRDLLHGELEVAIGLETVQPDVLPRLNKQMTLDDFTGAVERLRGGGVRVRAFILLRPPFLSEEEGVEWALRSLEFAFDAGSGCCAIIPTRSGNGILDQLHASGHFTPPTIKSMEAVLAAGIELRRGRVFVDLWDCERFFGCSRCGPQRRERMHEMNLTQVVLPPVRCNCESAQELALP